MADNDIQIVAGLDIPKSKSTIDKDIPVLEKELQNDKSSHPKLIATLDINKSKKAIQANLDTLISKTDAPKIKVGIDVGGLQETRSITTGLKDIQTQAIKSSNAIKNIKSNLLGVDATDVETTKFEVVKEGIDNILNLEKTLNNARLAFEKFGKVDLSWTKDEGGDLSSITAKITDATGITEKFRFKIEDTVAKWDSSWGSDSGVAKNIQNINKTYSEYTQKFAQFKSTNHELLSGLTQPLTEFETKLNGLKTGISTIEEVKSAYKSLQTASSNITQNFSRQLSPIDSAIRNISKGEETISGLKAEFKGLTNAPKEVNAELTKCASLLQNVKQIESEQGRTDVWSKVYREWIDLVDQLQAKLKTLRKEQINSASSEIFKTSDLKKADIPYMTKVSNTIEHQMAEIQKMSNAKGWQSFEVKGVEEANGKIKALTLTVRDAEGALKQLSMQRAKLDTGKKTYDGLMQVGDVKILETSVKAQQELNNEVAEYDRKINNAIKSLNGFANNTTFKNNSANSSVQMQKQAIQSLIAEYEHLKIQLQGNISPTGLKEIETHLSVLKSQFDTVQAETDELKAKLNLSRDLNRMSKDIDILRNRIAIFRNENTKSEKMMGDTFDSLDARLRDLKKLTDSGIFDKQAFANISRDFRNAEKEVKKFGWSGKTVFQTLGEQAKKFSSWMSLTYIIASLARSVRGAISELKEIDTVLTEISKTSDRTSESLERLGKASFDRASQYGRKASDYLTGVQEMSRAGFGEQESEDMAELSVLAQSAGDMTAELANQYLIATNAGYKLEGNAKRLNSILDSQNFITNRNALNLSELAEATKIVSSQASQAGIGIDEMTAAVGTMIATTQQGGEVASRSFKGRRTICTIALYGCKSIAA